MIVVDASVVVQIIAPVGASLPIERRLFESRVPLHAPALLDLEVANALRRRVLRGEVPAAAARDALQLCIRLPVVRHAHGPLLERIWALRHNLTAHDAAYVALAEGLGATLLTRDAALAGVGGHTAAVELL